MCVCVIRLPSGCDFHSSSNVQSTAPTAQQGVVGESSARNILDILQQKEAASKAESQAGNVTSAPQQGEYNVSFALLVSQQCRASWKVQRTPNLHLASSEQ